MRKAKFMIEISLSVTIASAFAVSRIISLFSQIEKSFDRAVNQVGRLVNVIVDQNQSRSSLYVGRNSSRELNVNAYYRVTRRKNKIHDGWMVGVGIKKRRKNDNC